MSELRYASQSGVITSGLKEADINNSQIYSTKSEIQSNNLFSLVTRTTYKAAIFLNA